MSRANTAEPTGPDASGLQVTDASGAQSTEDGAVGAAVVEDDDVLVEEVSIDGMCGVY